MINNENKSKVWVQPSCFYWPCQIDTIDPALKIYSDTQLQQVQTPYNDSPLTVQTFLTFQSSQYDSTNQANFIILFNHLGLHSLEIIINWQSEHSDTCQSKVRPLVSHKAQTHPFKTKFLLILNCCHSLSCLLVMLLLLYCIYPLSFMCAYVLLSCA